MNIQLNDLLYTLSQALDYVEHEITGVTTHHAKRVAYLSVTLAQALNLPDDRLSDLAAVAVLHDCGLPEIQRDFLSGAVSEKEAMRRHCETGELMIRHLPLPSSMENVILYHHENADGSGPFGKTAEQVPLEAQLIHFADQLVCV